MAVSAPATLPMKFTIRASLRMMPATIFLEEPRTLRIANSFFLSFAIMVKARIRISIARSQIAMIRTLIILEADSSCPATPDIISCVCIASTPLVFVFISLITSRGV